MLHQQELTETRGNDVDPISNESLIYQSKTTLHLILL